MRRMISLVWIKIRTEIAPSRRERLETDRYAKNQSNTVHPGIMRHLIHDVLVSVSKFFYST